MKPQTRELSKEVIGKAVERPKYAHIIKDTIGGEIGIKATSTGWWDDVGKVRELITALKRVYSQRRAALRIGISKDQIGDFLYVHPGFADKIADFQEALPMKLIDQINVAVDRGDMQTVRWAAERKITDEYGQKERAPIVIIPISMREDGKQFAIEASGEQTTLYTNQREGGAGVQFPGL